MNFLQAIILGIVEGITEFLPISSTAHMMIVSEFLKLTQSDFVKSFEIIIQLGAILAVFVIYFKSIIKNGFDNIKKIIVAFIPTAIIGFVLYKIVKTFLMGNNLIIVISLLIGGVGLIVIEKLKTKENSLEIKKEENVLDFSSISYKKSALIGIFQSIAMIPGISRSAATIIGGTLIGIERQVIVDFSFVLAIPTMAAATGYDVLKNYNIILSSGNFAVLAVGFVVAFIPISTRWPARALVLL
ncbi:MAG: undecaprenyl-diphosphate phosphatase [Patescibacteria group bacterium]